MQHKFCVYVYRDPRPGKNHEPIYVGKGKISAGRHRQHLWRCTNTRLTRKLNKIKNDGLAPIIEIVSRHVDEADAFLEERRLIAEYGRLDLSSGTLCNATDGGDGASGAVRADKEVQRLKAQWASGAGDSVNAGRAASWSDPIKKAARINAVKAANLRPGVNARRNESISKAQAKYWIYAEGKRYDSAIEAATDLGMTASNVYFKCKRGTYRRELRTSMLRDEACLSPPA